MGPAEGMSRRRGGSGGRCSISADVLRAPPRRGRVCLREAHMADLSSHSEARRGRVRDARGRAVSVLDPITMHLFGRRGSIESAKLEAIAEELEPGMGRRKKLVVWLVIPVVLLTIGGVTASIVIEGRPAWNDLISTVTNPVFLTPQLFCAIGLPWMIAHQARRKRTGRAMRVMLKHRTCPHCGYNLLGLPADETDGSTICPECASAWRLDAPGDPGEAAGAAPPRAHVGVMVGLVVLTLLGVLAMFGLLMARL